MITELAQLNHENQIHQTLQVAALSITTNPYQGLKHIIQLYTGGGGAVCTFNYH